MLSIKAEKRSVFGKDLKDSRTSGQLPVVVYGVKETTTPLFVSLAAFKKLVAGAGESQVVRVQTADGDKDALIHDVAWHPVTGEPLHADFYVIDKTKALKVNVPLKFSGVAPAVRDLGGILVKVLHELHIEVLPLNIPHDIPVDISVLAALNSQILVQDLAVPAGVKILNQADDVVAAVSVAKDEPIEEAPVDLSTIEVEKKGKKEVEGETPAEDKTDSEAKK